MRLRFDGDVPWTIDIVKRNGLRQLTRPRIRGLPTLARRSVFEYAYQVGTEYMGNGHGHEQQFSFRVGGDEVRRSSTLHHPATGQQVAVSHVTYRAVEGALEVARQVQWSQPITIRRAFVAMFPLGAFFGRAGDHKLVGAGVNHRQPVAPLSATSRLLRATATLEVDGATCMEIDDRSRTMAKLYAMRSTAEEPEDIEPGTVHESTATYRITALPGS